jgi:hypothetical protein
MKWRREVDYHGSRPYGSEDVRLGLPSVTIAWLGEIVKSKLRKLRLRRSPPAVLLKGRQRNFSMLGVAPADCPFPVKRQTREHDWRVLP